MSPLSKQTGHDSPSLRLAQALRDTYGQELSEEELINKLMKLAKRKHTTCWKWLNGKGLPPTPILIDLARQLKKPVDWLLCTEMLNPNPMVSIIEDTTKYKAKREEIITDTQEELWIQLRIGHTLTDNIYNILKLMRRGVGVKLLICDPDDVYVCDVNDRKKDIHITMEMVARRGYGGIRTAEAAVIDVRGIIERLREGAKDQSTSDRLEIMTVPYFPSTIVYISDPAREDGKLFAVTTNFKDDPYLAPVVVAFKSEHKAIFNHYCEQFKELWAFGKEQNDIKDQLRRDAI